jgi:hypothetical protein
MLQGLLPVGVSSGCVIEIGSNSITHDILECDWEEIWLKTIRFKEVIGVSIDRHHAQRKCGSNRPLQTIVLRKTCECIRLLPNLFGLLRIINQLLKVVAIQRKMENCLINVTN